MFTFKVKYSRALNLSAMCLLDTCHVYKSEGQIFLGTKCFLPTKSI